MSCGTCSASTNVRTERRLVFASNGSLTARQSSRRRRRTPRRSAMRRSAATQ
jgi:hypothetical protein